MIRITALFFSFLFPFLSFLLFPSFAQEPARPVVAIVGGGMAGIATLAFLKQGGHTLHLFEKEDRLGGNAVTRTVETGVGNQTISVDVGPQYFAHGGWDVYIEFLKYFQLFQKDRFTPFVSGMTIFREDQLYPDFITPSFSSPTFRYFFKKRSAVPGMRYFLKFFQAAYQVYLNPQFSEKVTVGEWLKTLRVPEYFKQNVVRPLLASVGNGKMENVDLLSFKSLVQGFAFRGPYKKSLFYVVNEGMGSLINTIGKKVEGDGSQVTVHTSSPVQEVIPLEDGRFLIRYGVEGKTAQSLIADQLVMGVHPYHAAKILGNHEKFRPLTEVLSKFTYIKAKLVLHHYRGFLHPRYTSFGNIRTSEKDDLLFSMNLGKVHPKYGKIIKSWILNPGFYETLKKESKILAEVDFHHPFVTPEFLAHQKELKRLARAMGNIRFVGGWTQIFETQNSAILSGYEAAAGLAPEISEYWIKHLPLLGRGTPTF